MDRPVFAGVIGPYSLAGRLMDVTEIMYMCIDEPETVHMVLEKAVTFLIPYCKAFQEAGADGVILAEPLAGLLSADMCNEFSCYYVRRIIEAVQSDAFSVIYHITCSFCFAVDSSDALSLVFLSDKVRIVSTSAYRVRTENQAARAGYDNRGEQKQLTVLKFYIEVY